MNKTELVNAVAEKADFSKKDADKAVAAVLDSITDALAQGDKVQIVGFGTFEVRARAEKQGRNPKTGEAMIVPASNLPAFKAERLLCICLPVWRVAGRLCGLEGRRGACPSFFTGQGFNAECCPLQNGRISI